jgi:hypothetical protein
MMAEASRCMPVAVCRLNKSGGEGSFLTYVLGV